MTAQQISNINFFVFEELGTTAVAQSYMNKHEAKCNLLIARNLF